MYFYQKPLDMGNFWVIMKMTEKVRPFISASDIFGSITSKTNLSDSRWVIDEETMEELNRNEHSVRMKRFPNIKDIIANIEKFHDLDYKTELQRLHDVLANGSTIAQKINDDREFLGDSSVAFYILNPIKNYIFNTIKKLD